MTESQSITRIEAVLDYIHTHLDEPITVASLAAKSCWSRWQLQRVFSEATGQTVAQYVRELRLSQAAERLICTQARHLEIALDCGFESEVSFNRAFRQMFLCTPGQYRRQGRRRGLRTPLRYVSPERFSYSIPRSFMQIRIENLESFEMHGLCRPIHGPFSLSPDFAAEVPKIWQTLQGTVSTAFNVDKLGVVDARYQSTPDTLCYWAGFQGALNLNSDKLSKLVVPEQEYAVIPVFGHVENLDAALRWFMWHWLPHSNYSGTNGFELEKYGCDYNPQLETSYMEYWLPITPNVDA